MPNILPAFEYFETIEATIDTDEHGMATAKVSYYADGDDNCLKLLRSGKLCPMVASGLMRSARFMHGDANQDGDGGVWKVNLVWRGAGLSLRLDEASIPSYKPIASTAPIETHFNFEAFAGTPAAPKPGAKFDGQGNFVQFKTYTDEVPTPSSPINPKAGIKNYYQASLKVGDKRVIEQKAINSQSDWFSVGKISKPDVRDLIRIKLRVPGLTGQVSNHLLTSVTLDDLGQGYALMNREWDMSGPYGWDTDIYEYEDTGDASTSTI